MVGQEFKPSWGHLAAPRSHCKRPPALPCGSSLSSGDQAHSKDHSCHQQVIDMLAPIPKGSRVSWGTCTRIFWNLKPNVCLSRTFWGNRLLSRAFAYRVWIFSFYKGEVGIWVLLAEMLPVFGIHRHASRLGECLRAGPVPSLHSLVPSSPLSFSSYPTGLPVAPRNQDLSCLGTYALPATSAHAHLFPRSSQGSCFSSKILAQI